MVGTLVDSTTLLADVIRYEDSTLGRDRDDAELEGMVSNFVDLGSFMVGGQEVDALSAEFSGATSASLAASFTSALTMAPDVRSGPAMERRPGRSGSPTSRSTVSV